MKKQTQRKPTRGKFSLLRQLCNLIPNHLVPQLAREHAVEEKSRIFRPWSHVVRWEEKQPEIELGFGRAFQACNVTPPQLQKLMQINEFHILKQYQKTPVEKKNYCAELGESENPFSLSLAASSSRTKPCAAT